MFKDFVNPNLIMDLIHLWYDDTVLALREVQESETPKNCPGTSKNQCQEVWDSKLLKIFCHL